MLVGTLSFHVPPATGLNSNTAPLAPGPPPKAVPKRSPDLSMIKPLTGFCASGTAPKLYRTLYVQVEPVTGGTSWKIVPKPLAPLPKVVFSPSVQLGEAGQKL